MQRVSDKRQQEIDAEAARWVARLSGTPLQPEERRALKDWLGAEEDHQTAFDFARRTWADLGALRSTPEALGREAREDAASMAPLKRRHRQQRSFKRVGGLAACLAIGLTLGALWFDGPVMALLADHRTAPGEALRLTLPDGSKAELGPASAVTLHFTAAERRIELLSGILHVETPPRDLATEPPFVVEAAGGRIEALGTEFTVEHLQDSIRVAVISKRVEVTPPTPSTASRSLLLSAAQSVRYGPSEGFGPVRSVSSETADAWREGRLLFDSVRLADVVATLNRYRRGRIVIADPVLAERRVSGLFETDSLEDSLDVIVLELGARKATLAPFVTLLF